MHVYDRNITTSNHGKIMVHCASRRRWKKYKTGEKNTNDCVSRLPLTTYTFGPRRTL